MIFATNVSVEKEMPSLRTPVRRSTSSTASAIIVVWTTPKMPSVRPVRKMKTSTATMLAKPARYMPTYRTVATSVLEIMSCLLDSRFMSSGVPNDASTRPRMIAAPTRVNFVSSP
jgi:hypothetical protein